jgi:hypothetical protein
MSSRKVKTADGRILDVSDKEWQYGRWWSKKIDQFNRELYSFRNPIAVEKGGESSAHHFRRIVSALWPEGGTKPFIWHPWAERMLEAACENQYLAVAGCASSGKCLAPHVPVLMFDGTVKRNDAVRTGDQLMGPDSKPRNVLTTNSGRSNMVRIVPKKGDPWECNDDHILTLKRAWSGKSSQKRVGELIDISVKDYLAKGPAFWARFKLVCTGVEFPEQPVEIDPRVYGIWLGDGTTGRPVITCSPKTDVDVSQYLKIYFKSEGYGVAVAKYGDKCPSFLISHGGDHGNPFFDLVKESSGNPPLARPWEGEKRILRRYLINSREKRMRLLAGILDADGHAAGTYYEISCSYQGLAEDIVFLARSLGFRVTVKDRDVKFNGKSYPAKRIFISGATDTIPTLRKKCVPKKKRKNSDCTSFEVQQLGGGDWFGYTLDGDGRFLLGDFTVTHNTDFFAIWAIVNFIAAPYDTMVLVTSTTLKDSRKRIWGSVRDYWQAAPPLPGKLVDSMGLIRFEDGTGGTSDKCGITLIAAEKKKEKEAVGKLIGFKNKRVIVIADEMPELSESILEASASNLSLNPEFQFVGIGNPASRFDAFGILSKPKNGWQSISPLEDEWDTDRGLCIRFDGEKSPNVVTGKLLYPWIVTQAKLDEAKARFGENSLAYYRMFRGYWAPTGDEDNIYSETEIIAAGADSPAIWLEPPTQVAALDPAFTNGGDRTPVQFGEFGISRDGIPTLMFTHRKLLQDNVHDKKKTRTEQIVQQFRDVCSADGVDPWCAAYDKSGAGGPFGDVVSMVWAPEVLGVQFGGKASDLPVSISDTTLSTDRYTNRVTELWFGAKELIRTGQLKGIDRELAKEMCSRKYSTKKGTSLRMEVESKTDMKARTGESPDLADAAMILIELCRQRFGFGGMTVTMKRNETSIQVKRKTTFGRLFRANSGKSLKFNKFSI